MSDADVEWVSLRLERLRAQIGLVETANKEPEKLSESERVTFGPVLPFAFPAPVLTVLAGRVVVASSGAARFLPVPRILFNLRET